MLLTPTEMERLTIFSAAELARRRRAKGLKLNHPEAGAIITDEILEGSREGRSVADLMSLGSTILSTSDVMSGVASMVPILQVEGVFPAGDKVGRCACADPPQGGGGSRYARARRNRRRRRRDRAFRRPSANNRRGRQHRRPPGADRFALSFFRG